MYMYIYVYMYINNKLQKFEEAFSLYVYRLSYKHDH